MRSKLSNKCIILNNIMQKNNDNLDKITEDESEMARKGSEVNFSTEENLEDDIENEEFATSDTHVSADGHGPLQIEEQSKDGRFKRVINANRLV